MKKELKEKWIGMLESGEYKQGKYYLRTMDDEYCCLGVLREAAGLEWIETDGDAYGTDSENPHFEDLSVQEAGDLGLSSFDQCLLVDINDGENRHKHNPEFRQFNFREIADWIRENIQESNPIEP